MAIAIAAERLSWTASCWSDFCIEVRIYVSFGMPKRVLSNRNSRPVFGPSEVVLAALLVARLVRQTLMAHGVRLLAPWDSAFLLRFAECS